MTETERRSRLIGWLEIIYKDVQDVVVDAHVFWEIQKMFETNSRLLQTPSIVNSWMASGFAQSAALGVRRQADNRQDSVSLHRFLFELQKDPLLASRQHYISLFENPDIFGSLPDGQYDRLVGKDRPNPDPLEMKAEIRELIAKTDKIKHYVDKRVAHYDQIGLQKAPTFNDLTDCLTLFERLIKKYKPLLTGANITNLLPTFQYDWKAVFKFPWLADPSTEPEAAREDTPDQDKG